MEVELRSASLLAFFVSFPSMLLQKKSTSHFCPFVIKNYPCDCCRCFIFFVQPDHIEGAATPQPPLPVLASKFEIARNHNLEPAGPGIGRGQQPGLGPRLPLADEQQHPRKFAGTPSMGVGRIFSRRGANWIFPEGGRKDPRGTKSGEMKEATPKFREKHFFIKKLTAKVSNFKIQGVIVPPLPTSVRAMFFLCIYRVRFPRVNTLSRITNRATNRNIQHGTVVTQQLVISAVPVVDSLTMPGYCQQLLRKTFSFVFYFFILCHSASFRDFLRRQTIKNKPTKHNNSLAFF